MTRLFAVTDVFYILDNWTLAVNRSTEDYLDNNTSLLLLDEKKSAITSATILSFPMGNKNPDVSMFTIDTPDAKAAIRDTRFIKIR